MPYSDSQVNIQPCRLLYFSAVCPSVVYITICSPRPLMKSIQNSCSAFTNEQAGIHALARKPSTGSSLSGRFPGVLQGASSFLVYRTHKITLLSWCGRWPWNPKSKCPTVLMPPSLPFKHPCFQEGRWKCDSATRPGSECLYLCTSRLHLIITSAFSLIILWLVHCHFQGKKVSISCWWNVLIFLSFSKSFSSPPNTPCLRLFSCEFLRFSKSSLDGSLEFL